MLSSLTRARVIQIWFVVVAITGAAGVVLGIAVTASTAVLLLASCLVPPAILLFMWRDAPPTAAEVLNATERR